MRIYATAAAAVLVAALASPTLAAPKHRNHGKDATRAYGTANPGGYYAPNSNGRVVAFGNRVIGQDPDPNIRLQMRRDPNPGNY